MQCHLPGTPKLDADKTSDTYVLGENEDKQGYVLNVNSFKQKLDLADEEKITKAMDAMYLQLKSSLGTKASKMTKGTFGPDKLPTRYYEFDLADGGIYWTRAVLTENSIISITISGPKAWAQGEKAQAFLKSLKVDSGK